MITSNRYKYSCYGFRQGFWLILLFLIVQLTPAYSQLVSPERPIAAFPPPCDTVKGESRKLFFLAKIIKDSIDENRLIHVRSWSRFGLEYASKMKMDSLKGVFLLFIGKAYTYLYVRLDSAIFYYRNALPYFQNRLDLNRITALREIMEGFSESGNKDSTFIFLDSVKSIMAAMPDTSRIRIQLSQVVGTIFNDFGMSRSAMPYFQFAVKGCLQNGNKKGLGMALANIALVYEELDNFKKAISHSREAAGYLTKSRMPYSIILSNLGSDYYNINEFDSAKFFISESNKVAQELELEDLKAINNNLLGSIYTHEKKFPEALLLLNKNLVFFDSALNPTNHIKTLLFRSEYDTAIHDFSSAQKYAEKALSLSRKTSFRIQEALSLQILSAINKVTNNYQQAFAYQQELMNVKDSTDRDRIAAELDDLEVFYKTQQKEQRIQSILMDNNIKDLKLQNGRRMNFFYLAAFFMLLVILAIIFYQRNLRNKISMQKLKAELEMKVMRLQMNPHFIFNSLNSIENFIMMNEKRLASDYLNKFARLIRMILDSSLIELAPIAKDMEAIQLYIDLEQLRFSNKFSYSTYVDPLLLSGDYRAPALLVQPYVENAIVHGLAHSEKINLNLSVTATLEDEKMKYVVQDNGIGRSRSKEYNLLNKPYHQSVGLKIAEQRINLFNNNFHGSGSVKITDLFDDRDIPSGTKVEIIINTV
ncbi:MAG: histidine kinase [Flavitalea sp.]